MPLSATLPEVTKLVVEGLGTAPRLLVEVPLAPVQGSRFQPTGFPDLGAATFQAVQDGRVVDMLLVESAQSMANRLEEVCWDKTCNDWVTPLQGLPYVKVQTTDGRFVTTSVLESHRLNSPYILEGKNKTFFTRLQTEMGAAEKGMVDLSKLARLLLKYDVNALLHGIFLAKKELAGGRLRMARTLSAFIEASDVRVVATGGVKKDEYDPQGDTKKGFGHVPFHRDEYTGDITAYFNLDLAQLRGLGLETEVEQLVIFLAMFKILRFLEQGLRLRTACDLTPTGPMRIVRPETFVMPSLAEVEKALPSLIAAASRHFAAPAVTLVTYEPAEKADKKAKD